MAAYAAAQNSRASSVGSGEVIIRWVSRIPAGKGRRAPGAQINGHGCALGPHGYQEPGGVHDAGP